MEYSASGAEAIPFMLISIIIPIIIFMLVPIFIIRSVVKAIKNQLPAGASFSQLKEIAQQFPKGTNWQTFINQWEIKVDPGTRKITLKRKPGAPLPPGKNVQTEIQLDSLAQLPEFIKKLSGPSSQTAIPEPPSPAPVSESSKISHGVQGSNSDPFQSPKGYEVAQTIKRVALVLLLLGFFYALKDFLA